MQEIFKKVDTSLRKLEFHSLLPKAIRRFPILFDQRLTDGLERFAVNASSNFLKERPAKHIRSLLLTQFFLQKKMENLLDEEEVSQKHLFLKLFPGQSRVCLAMIYSGAYGFQREQLLKAFHTLLPGIREIPRSFYLWYNCDYSYYFCYLEVHKLRGQEFSKRELRRIGKTLQNQLLAVPPLTPALFWPYNKEESIRQIQLLQREMNSADDLPHISVHFREQTSTSLEFLIHFVRPKGEESLDQALKRLPDSLHCFCQFLHVNKTPFEIEMGVFSFKVPSAVFDVHDSINLLYARRYVLKYLEEIIGPYRDYNGGLFEKQQQHFEAIRFHLGDKIPHFDLFAEKFFYALNRIEKWLSLSMDEAEYLFSAFSELIQEKTSRAIKRHLKSFTIIKTPNSADLHKHLNTESTSHAQIMIGDYHYLCLLEPKISHFQIGENVSKKRVLKLVLQEGPPPSLNPHYSSGDMRSRILNKLLFEGLTRLNELGIPELAGAVHSTEERLFYRFKLRSYRWSNGENVTALDYAASWQGALNDHLSHPELYFGIKNARNYKEKKCDFKEVGIRVIDAETLQIELERPDPRFLYKLAQPYFFPLFGSLREPKWFNGPYLVRQQNYEGILIERNPYFWDSDRVYFDQIEFKLAGSPDAIFSSLQKGEVDWCGDPLDVLSSNHIHQLESEGKLQKRPVSRRFFLYFNTRHPLLASPLIRRALSLVLDRSWICSQIFPNSRPEGPILSSKQEAVQLFKRGLEALGWTEPLPTLTFSYSDHTRRAELAAYLKSVWQETLGLPVRIEAFEWNHFRSNLEKRSFEICGTIQDTIDEDSLNYLARFEGTSSWNFSQWTHPLYRDLLNRGETALAKKILQEESSITPLFNYVHLYAQNPQLERCLFDEEGCIDFSWSFIKD